MHLRALFLVSGLTATLLASTAPQARAAGFEITEQSAHGLGMAYAGSGASGADASVVWFNPAAMVLRGHELQNTVNLITPQFEFTDQGSRQLVPGGSLPLLPGAVGSRNGGEPGLVPNLYYIRPLDEHWVAGFAVNAPYGLVTNYSTGWTGQYQADKSSVLNINANPSLAYRLNRHWSLGLGVSLNYIKAELSNVLDFAAICGQLVAGVCPNGALPGQGQFDGYVRNKADDLSFGANIGVLWQGRDTRVGLSWRSQVNHQLSGDANFATPTDLGGTAALGPLGDAMAAVFATTGVETNLSLPDMLVLSWWHRLTPKLSVAANAFRTDWSDVKEVRLRFDNPLTPDGVERLDFNAAWRLAVGAEYRISDSLQVRAGWAMDRKATPNRMTRSARVPDDHRRMLSVGATWRWRDHLVVDAGYTRLQISETPIERLGNSGDLLVGSFDSNANLLGVQLRLELP